MSYELLLVLVLPRTLLRLSFGLFFGLASVPGGIDFGVEGTGDELAVIAMGRGVPTLAAEDIDFAVVCCTHDNREGIFFHVKNQGFGLRKLVEQVGGTFKSGPVLAQTIQIDLILVVTFTTEDVAQLFRHQCVELLKTIVHEL